MLNKKDEHKINLKNHKYKVYKMIKQLNKNRDKTLKVILNSLIKPKLK